MSGGVAGRRRCQRRGAASRLLSFYCSRSPQRVEMGQLRVWRGSWDAARGVRWFFGEAGGGEADSDLGAAALLQNLGGSFI